MLGRLLLLLVLLGCTGSNAQFKLFKQWEIVAGQTDFTQIGNASYLVVPIYYGEGNSVVCKWNPTSTNFDVHQTLNSEAIFGEFFNISEEHFLFLQVASGFVVYQYDHNTTMFVEVSSILPSEGVNYNIQLIQYNNTMYMIMPYTNYNTTIIIFTWNQTTLKFDPIQIIFVTAGNINMVSEVFEAIIYDNQLLLFYGNTDKQAQLYVMNATGLFELVQVFDGPVPGFGSLSEQADGLYLVIGWVATGWNRAGPLTVSTYKWDPSNSSFDQIASAKWTSNYGVTGYNSVVFQLQNATILAVPTNVADGLTLYEWNTTDYKTRQELLISGEMPVAVFSVFTIDDVMFLTAFGLQPAPVTEFYYLQFFTYNTTVGVDDSNGAAEILQVTMDMNIN